MPGRRRALRFAREGGVPGRSLRVAVVVGTPLNLINQGDALPGGGGGAVDRPKLGLTCTVPYFVGPYGAVAFRLQAERGAGAADGRDPPP